MVFEMKCHSQPVNSFTVTQIQMRMKMMKNCVVRFTTHCIVIEIGGVYCLPLGCSMTKTDQTTAEIPTYTENMIIQRAAVKHVPNILLFTVYSTSPSPLSPFLTLPPTTKG